MGRKTKITQEEFEDEFWIHEQFNHRHLCAVFNGFGVLSEFRRFWNQINIKNYFLASEYTLSVPRVRAEAAMLRLMIAQEFIAQFNERLEEL